METDISKPWDNSGTSCIGGQIDSSDVAPATINVLQVAGLGALSLPLSPKDVIRLREASIYVPGSTAIVKGRHCGAWQLNIPAFYFPRLSPFLENIVPVIATEVCKALGLHETQVQAQLSKLLLCEHDDFRFQTDLKERPGIATMLIPISTKVSQGFKGGVVVAAKGSRLMTFDSHGTTLKNSRTLLSTLFIWYNRLMPATYPKHWQFLWKRSILSEDCLLTH